MSGPRTRRQLREALAIEQASRKRAVARVDDLQALLAAVEPQLEADGWTATREMGFIVTELPSGKRTLPPVIKWTAPDRAAAEKRVVADAVNGARRGVLTTVINALGIKGYARGSGVDVDRFWADIQTAIEVREEKRVADERSGTEAKVARLARGENPFLVTGAAIDTQAIRDMLNRRGQVVVTEPYPDFAFGSTPRKPAPPTIISRLGQVVITHSAAQPFSVWASDTQDGPAEKVGDLAAGDSLVVSDQPYHKQRWYFVTAESGPRVGATSSDRVPFTVKPLVNTDALSTAAPKKKSTKKKKSENAA